MQRRNVSMQCHDVNVQRGNVNKQCDDVRLQCGIVNMQRHDVSMQCGNVRLHCRNVNKQCRNVSKQYDIAASLSGLFTSLFPAEAVPNLPAGDFIGPAADSRVPGVKPAKSDSRLQAAGRGFYTISTYFVRGG
jgi:hypothetical protein